MVDNSNKSTDILEEEYQVYQKLYELSLKKEKIILNEKIDELNKITTEENKLLEKAEKLHQKREKIEMKDQIEETDPKLRDDLIELSTKLREQNLLNFRFIRDKRQINNLNMAIKSGDSKQQGTYNKQGQHRQKQQWNMVNHKA